MSYEALTTSFFADSLHEEEIEEVLSKLSEWFSSEDHHEEEEEEHHEDEETEQVWRVVSHTNNHSRSTVCSAAKCSMLRNSVVAYMSMSLICVFLTLLPHSNLCETSL